MEEEKGEGLKMEGMNTEGTHLMERGGKVEVVKGLQVDYITSPSGRKKAVILPIREYELLLEDLHDLSVERFCAGCGRNYSLA